MTTTKTFDCDHEFQAAVAGTTLPDGRRVCRVCAERYEYDLFMADTRELQADKGPFFCYLSNDERTLTTWTGYKLAQVTELWYQTVGFGYRTKRWYFTAVDANGRKWYGNSPGPGMYARARLAKS